MTSPSPVEFYVLSPDGAQSGPYSRQQMRDMYERGAFSPDHRLRRTIDERWFRLQNVSGLFDRLEPGLYVPPEAVAIEGPIAPPPPSLSELPPPSPSVRPAASQEPSRGLTESSIGPFWIPNKTFNGLVEEFKTVRSLTPTDRSRIEEALRAASAARLDAPAPGSTPVEVRFRADGSIELAVPKIDPVPAHLWKNRTSTEFWAGFVVVSVSLAGALVGGFHQIPGAVIIAALVMFALRSSRAKHIPYSKASGLATWRRLGWQSVVSISSWFFGAGMGGVVISAVLLLVRDARDVDFHAGVLLFFIAVGGAALGVRTIAVKKSFAPRVVRVIMPAIG